MATVRVTLDELMEKLTEVGLSSNVLVKSALSQAQKTHERQKADDGSPNIEQHIYAVTLSVVCYAQKYGNVNPELVASALLHDVLEDEPTLNNEEELFRHAFSDKVYATVKTLTKGDYKAFPGKTAIEQKRARDNAYFDGLKHGSEDAKIIKLADRLNNISRVHTSPNVGKVAEYVEETEAFFLPLAKATSQYFYEKILLKVNDLKKNENANKK